MGLPPPSDQLTLLLLLKKYHFEIVNDALANLKMITVLEHLDQRETESEYKAFVENLKLKGSSWSRNRIASLTMDFYKNWTQNGSSYVELPKKGMSILDIENKKR